MYHTASGNLLLFQQNNSRKLVQSGGKYLDRNFIIVILTIDKKHILNCTTNRWYVKRFLNWINRSQCHILTKIQHFYSILSVFCILYFGKLGPKLCCV